MLDRLLFAAALALASAAAAADLPDFTALVREQAAAVVNIVGTPEEPAELPDSPLADEPDESREAVRDFFRRYFGAPNLYDRRSLGSGFVLDPDGIIVTNAHLAEGAGTLIVRLDDRREFEARVIGVDPVSDIAVLKIDARGLTPVKPGDAKALRAGEWVAAMGSPFGFERSVTVGVVSAIDRLIPEESFLPFIQTDVAVNPGNSGGPLFNVRGEVVGVNSAIFTASGGYMGLSFAVPMDIALEVARELIARGSVRRGRIGVHLQEVTVPLARALGLERAAGALISQVVAGSPAERAGLRAGDVVLRFGAAAIAAHVDLVRLVAHALPGTAVDGQAVRFGRPVGFRVTVEEVPAPAQTTRTAVTGSSVGERTGLRFAPRDARQDARPDARQRKPAGTRRGLVVHRAEGPARRAGLDMGDVVLSVNGRTTDTLEQFDAAVSGAPAGATLALYIEREGMRQFVALRLAE